MRRRTFTIAVASSVLAGALSVPAYARRADLTLRLPAPTGPWRVGTTTRHLVDRDRSDPWNGATTRELMTTVFYPPAAVRGYPLAAHLTPAAAALFKGLDAGILHPELPTSGVDWAATMTHSYVDAPAIPVRRPVLLYSPGGADPRTIAPRAAPRSSGHQRRLGQARGVHRVHVGEDDGTDQPDRDVRHLAGQHVRRRALHHPHPAVGDSVVKKYYPNPPYDGNLFGE
ncbi:hypothetical protein ACGFIF_43860 [Kribbella sp. NPDC049174]|uniref:hypothetical protein n=1 Tax=Kribbella sp. NPDC049174 TaxID=3364112 RepID=UPI003711E0C0